MDSLYSEMHDHDWCMREFPSKKSPGEVFYCGARIPRGKELCSKCQQDLNNKGE